MRKCNKLTKVIILILSVAFLLSLTASAGEKVYVGGFPFGIKMRTDGVFVTEIGEVDSTVGKVSPARDAGIKEGDIIISINQIPIGNSQEVADAVSMSMGKRLKVEIKRDCKPLTVNLIPVKSVETDEYKTGLFIKDSASGIGTVTYVKDDERSFGGLGHGITDRTTQSVLPLKEGTVHNAVINGINKGSENMPGELKGTLDTRVTGTLLKNTSMGVFGKFDRELRGLSLVEIADVGEIKEGNCVFYSCLEGTTPEKIEGEISKIVDKSSKTKNFIVTVTDKKALEKSGGIVQGMSGSPIIQSGKLVGALTHVLMSDQKSGYGIFIENMLEGANKIK